MAGVGVALVATVTSVPWVRAGARPGSAWEWQEGIWRRTAPSGTRRTGCASRRVPNLSRCCPGASTRTCDGPASRPARRPRCAGARGPAAPGAGVCGADARCASGVPTGCGPSWWRRSGSPSGPVTAGCATPATSGCAMTSRPRTSYARIRRHGDDHPHAPGRGGPRDAHRHPGLPAAALEPFEGRSRARRRVPT
jgi:hypothetical protein